MSVAPTAESQRILSLDMVRGLAVLGILAVNAPFFAAPWQTGINPTLAPLAVDETSLWTWFVMHVFFEFKFVTLFSLLFGASIFLVGGERSDAARGAVLRRRLIWLAVIGLVHGLLIWCGDILLTYALAGFIVMLCRSWRPMTLMLTGAGVTIAWLGLMALAFMALGMTPAEKMGEIIDAMWTPPDAEIARVIAAYQGGLVSATMENISTWLVQAPSAVLFVARTIGVMMIGMALFKWGVFSGRAPAWLYVLLILLGGAALAVIWMQAQAHIARGFQFADMQGLGAMANLSLAIFASLGYASVLILIAKTPVALLLSPLAAVGRMAFTNYLTQSLIMTTIFWGGRGFGLFGEVDRLTLAAIVAGVWVLQLIWSPLWLARFEMGPFEWVWRRLSYSGHVQISRAAHPNPEAGAS